MYVPLTLSSGGTEFDFWKKRMGKTDGTTTDNKNGRALIPKFGDSSRLDVVEIVRVDWHASFQPL